MTSGALYRWSCTARRNPAGRQDRRPGGQRRPRADDPRVRRRRPSGARPGAPDRRPPRSPPRRRPGRPRPRDPDRGPRQHRALAPRVHGHLLVGVRTARYAYFEYHRADYATRTRESPSDRRRAPHRARALRPGPRPEPAAQPRPRPRVRVRPRRAHRRSARLAPSAWSAARCRAPAHAVPHAPRPPGSSRRHGCPIQG